MDKREEAQMIAIHIVDRLIARTRSLFPEAETIPQNEAIAIKNDIEDAITRTGSHE